MYRWLLVIVAFTLAGCSVERSDNSRASNASSSPRNIEIDYSVVSSLHRIVPRAPQTEEAEKEIRLTAARGEVEGAQIIAWSREGAPRVTFVGAELTGAGGAKIPAERVKVYFQQAVRVERGSPAGRRGVYLDPLIPASQRALEIAKDERLYAWVDVSVPVGAQPGEYTGSVEVRSATKGGRAATGENGLHATIPLHLTVRNAVLPTIPSLGSSIGFDASQMVRFEKVELGSEELREVTDAYAKQLAAARLSIADVGVVPPNTLPNNAGNSADDAFLTQIFERRGVASVRIPFYMDFPFADPLGRDRRNAIAYLRSAAKWAESHGYLDRAYVYAIDEPDESRAGEVRELHELVKAADRRLKLLVTREASAKEFRGSVDIWSPNINPTRFKPADVRTQARQGRDTWWYPSITSYQPYPTLFIDDLRPAPRALGWMAWRYNVKGILYWSATHWHEVEDPYSDTATYKETDAVGNGDGVLLYPGAPAGQKGKPVPSVRLFQLRDGIDDHDLFTMAACYATAKQRSRLNQNARRLAPQLDQIAASDASVANAREYAFNILDNAEKAGRYNPEQHAKACNR